AGEHDFPGGGADQSSHRLASVFDPPARGLAFFMNARSVTVYIRQRLMQRFENGGMHRCGGVVVEVDAHQRSITGTIMKRTLLAAAVAFIFIVPNIFAQSNNSPAPSNPPDQ